MKFILNSILVGATLGMAATAYATEAQGVTDKEIVLGMHTDLSGVAASFGVPVANAFQMRIDEANAAGGIHGRKIRLVVEDTGYQVPRAVQAANKLLNRDKVFAMVGNAGTQTNNAVFPIQEKAGVPNLFPISWARTISEPVNPLQFAIYQTYPNQVRAGVRYMVEKKHKKAVCALYQDTDYGRDVFSGITEQLKAMNLPLVAEASHSPTETDFTVSISRLREAGCDLIALGTIVRDTIVPYTVARKQGWTDVDFIGTAGIYDLTVSSAQGGATEGLYATGFFDPPYRDTANPEVAKWFDAYTERFGREPAIQAALGQVIMDLTLKAIDAAGPDLTVKSLTNALEHIEGYQDMFNGPLQSLSPTNHASANSSRIYVVHNGRWELVGESAVLAE